MGRGADETIWVVDESPEGKLLGDSVRRRSILEVSALKHQMRTLLNVVSDIFDQADAHSSMALSEVELTVEINAEGQVSLIGTGSKTSNKGAITLKFTRSESS